MYKKIYLKQTSLFAIFFISFPIPIPITLCIFVLKSYQHLKSFPKQLHKHTTTNKSVFWVKDTQITQRAHNSLQENDTNKMMTNLIPPIPWEY